MRLFRPESLRAMVKEATARNDRGTRCTSHRRTTCRQQVSRSAEYDRIFELERKLGGRPEFAAIARYTQFIAHRPTAVTEDGA